VLNRYLFLRNIKKFWHKEHLSNHCEDSYIKKSIGWTGSMHRRFKKFPRRDSAIQGSAVMKEIQ